MSIARSVAQSVVKTVARAVTEGGASSGGGGGSFDYLTNALAGYATKKLKSTSTVAIRVRRSSDNAESDIGFTGNTLDTTALLAFAGAGSAFIAKWYDQSGNAKDVVQSTTGNQPRIVNSGVYDEGVVFDGSNDLLTLGARVTAGSPAALTWVGWVKTTANGGKTLASEYMSTADQRGWACGIFSDPGVATDNKFTVWISADGGTVNFKAYSSATAINTNSWVHVGFTFGGGVLKLYINGAEETTTKHLDAAVAAIFNTSANFLVGVLNAGAAYSYSGLMRDTRVFSVAKSAAEIAAIYGET